MKSVMNRRSDGTIQFVVTVAWKIVSENYDRIVDEAVKQVEVKGFRKGKAPRNLAEKELKKDKLYEEVIKSLVSKAYSSALTEHTINPIVQPEIRLTKATDGQDWEFTIETCEKPEVKLDTYKITVQKAKGEVKKDDLWLPGKAKEDQLASQKRQKTLNSILELLLKETNITIPGVLIKAEVERRLASLFDELQKLGLTVDQYAKSKNMQPQDLKSKYEHEIANTYRLEFILEGIADLEKIIVEDNEVDDVVNKAKDQKEKESLQKNRYYMTSLLRRQKTLDILLSL